MPQKILVVAHDAVLRASRSTLLLQSGYSVTDAASVDGAIALLESDTFDLVVVGRDSLGAAKGNDQRIRERCPAQLILKIVKFVDEGSEYASRITDSFPRNVLAAVSGMFAEQTKEADYYPAKG